MKHLSILSSFAGSLIATALLPSCSIRLPVQPHLCQQLPVRLETQPAPAAQAPDVLVWLIADAYHTGMVFPYDWLVESGFVPPAGFGKPQSVVMSWGARCAYSKQGVNTPWKFFRVFFTPSPSVVEMIPVNWNVAEVCSQQRIWRKLVPRTRGPALASFLNACTIQQQGRPKVICESSWGHGVQLEGRYPYFLPRICNVWTAQTIECLGGRINPWRALTANSLIRQAEKPPNDFEEIWPGDGSPPKPRSATGPPAAAADPHPAD